MNCDIDIYVHCEMIPPIMLISLKTKTEQKEYKTKKKKGKKRPQIQNSSKYGRY